MPKQTKLEKPIDPADVKAASTLTRRIWLFVGIALALLLVWLGSVFATSPAPIRNPKFEHYHFRMQVLVDGKAENFGADKYQATYEAGNCNIELTDRPIHFHDNKDQFVHIHWDGMTGGMVLKNYGWNFIGGSDSVLGYRFDEPASIKSVSTHSRSLPDVPRDSEIYIYTGDETSHIERSFEQFKSQDLEVFLGKKSRLNASETTGWLNWLFPKASAHGGHAHEEPQNLEAINNLLGNVVIFVQKERPAYEQVRERFKNLEPLSTSSCGG